MTYPVEFDIPLTRGTLHAARWGEPTVPLTFCVHGLSANLHAFDFLAERLAGPDRQVVAIDLRGRGAATSPRPERTGSKRTPRTSSKRPPSSGPTGSTTSAGRSAR
jgi:pimeloyl-ACP methyl ester carboxylesterase